MRAIIFDTETTGLNEPEIVSAAWIDVAADEWTLINEQKFKPSKPIELGAAATHHILPCDLEDCPPSDSFRLPDGVAYLIGWNVDYDWAAIGSPDVKRIDLCCIARRLFPDLDAYSQAAVYYHLFGMTDLSRNFLRSAHSAADDVRNCRAIYETMIRQRSLEGNIEALWRFSEECRIPNVMPFGKLKGQPISQVDEGYRRWYRGCTNPPPDQYILKAFEKYPAI